MHETFDLGIAFGGLKAAQNINLKIKKNELYGLIGPNGAGKTTVFNMLTGVYLPTTGTFALGGENLTGCTQENAIISANNPWSKTFDPTMIYAPVDGAMAYLGVRIKL